MNTIIDAEGDTSYNPHVTLGSLADMRRWCAWNTIMRAGKPTKVPYGSGNIRCKTNDPIDWVLRDIGRIIAGNIGGGLGIMLGALGNGWTLLGLDLDNCLGVG